MAVATIGNTPKAANPTTPAIIAIATGIFEVS
jgi:hypothetical protein